MSERDRTPEREQCSGIDEHGTAETDGDLGRFETVEDDELLARYADEDELLLNAEPAEDAAPVVPNGHDTTLLARYADEDELLLNAEPDDAAPVEQAGDDADSARDSADSTLPARYADDELLLTDHDDGIALLPGGAGEAAMSDRRADDDMAPAVPTRVHVAHQPDGSVEGYRTTNTLPWGVEMQRQLRRRRTAITLAFLALLPVLVWGAFALGGNDDEGRRFVDFATSSGLNFATFTLFASTNFLLVVVVALFFGDTVASEASWSSLRYLLAAPIPRTRLLRQKALVAAALSGIGLLVLSLIALAIGLLVHGGGQLVSPGGHALDLLPGLVSFAGAVLYLAVYLTWVAGLAMWLSVATDAPLGAVGGAVVVSIVSSILDQITALGALRSFLPTHYATAWQDLLSDEVDWANMINGAATSLTYATAFGVLAVLHFSRKDITS